jgi:hypothetical protein
MDGAFFEQCAPSHKAPWQGENDRVDTAAAQLYDISVRWASEKPPALE